MDLKARTLKKAIDTYLQNLVQIYKNLTVTSISMRNLIATFIKDNPQAWENAYTPEERTEITDINITIETIEAYVTDNLPDLPNPQG